VHAVTDAARASGASPAAARILEAAEPLVQLRGFNAVSYADIAAVLGVTTASLHYHYRTKAALGEALITRYARDFAVALAAIEKAGGRAPEQLAAYVGLYAAVLEGRRMCLCGVLAAEYETLPPSMQRAVVAFFDANEAWLSGVLERGRAEESLRFDGGAAETARAIVGALEGALLVARSYRDRGRFDASARTLLEALTRPATRRDAGVEVA
jgi:TetR/AcrR family transcriptional regulator, transcriptional repressor for nem operon